MHREIKFRAWVEGDKKMYPVNKLKWPPHPNNPTDKININCPISDVESISGEDFLLMQYTGLLDKNGKEIYEGDILEFYDGDRKDEVVFEQGFFRYKDDCTPIFQVECEVIGNIYENPELLTD